MLRAMTSNRLRRECNRERQEGKGLIQFKVKEGPLAGTAINRQVIETGRGLGVSRTVAEFHSIVSKWPTHSSASILGFLIWHSRSNNTCPHKIHLTK